MTTFPETGKSESDKNVNELTKITNTKNHPNLELDGITELQETSEASPTKTLITAPTPHDSAILPTDEESNEPKEPKESETLKELIKVDLAGNVYVTDKGKSKNRCNMCRKKLNLATISAGKCSCDNVYCGEHRMPENHKCTFDRKGKWREELIKRNPKIIAAKINKV